LSLANKYKGTYIYELVGHWDITVPSGLMFMEFISDNRVLIGDRGAIGEQDVSKHYFQDYTFTDNEVINLPLGCKMVNIEIAGDRMTFVFLNEAKGYRQEYTAHKGDATALTDKDTDMVTQTWITTEQNGKTIAPENQKLAYFSKAGIYFIKDMNEDNLQLFSWNWNSSFDNHLCYTPYQRPTFIPQESCMNFIELTDSYSIFETDGLIIKMEATSDF